MAAGGAALASSRRREEGDAMKKPRRKPFVRIACALLAFGMSERKVASCLRVPRTTLREALASRAVLRAALVASEDGA